MLPELRVDDVVALLDTGAYGAVMASNYNRRLLAPEVLVDEAQWTRDPAPPDARRRAGARERDRLMRGLLIAFEGLDQSGKQTQAELLRDRLIAAGRAVRLLSFPDYETPIGEEIERALRGARDYAPDVMQLLYVANRYEWKSRDRARAQRRRRS